MATTDADPWDAVLAHLTRPADRAPATRPAPGTRPVAVARSGRPYTAKPETIRLLKERASNDRRLYAVTFDDDGRYGSHLEFVGVEQNDTGSWKISGAAGGAGTPPHRDKPWINLAGWWGANRFCAGGQVLGTNDAHSVRLTSRDGTTLEDDTDAGIVLFIADRELQLPVTLEMRDHTGHTIASQLDFETPD
jgi:hypothetical protein